MVCNMENPTKMDEKKEYPHSRKPSYAVAVFSMSIASDGGGFFSEADGESSCCCDKTSCFYGGALMGCLRLKDLPQLRHSQRDSSL